MWALQPYVYMCMNRFIAINFDGIDNELIIATFFCYSKSVTNTIIVVVVDNSKVKLLLIIDNKYIFFIAYF